MKATVAIAAALLVMTQSLAAQSSNAPVSTPGADKLLEALAKGDRNAAVRQVLAIESLSGRPQPVATPAEFVSKVLGCKVDKAERRGGYMQSTMVDWTCPDGRYRALLFEDDKGPFVVVGEFYDPARLTREFDSNGRSTIKVAAPPPMPPASGSSQLPRPDPDMATLNRLGNAMAAGKLGALGGNISPSARISLGRRDPVYRVTRIEEVGIGPEGFARILPIARGKLKGLVNPECKIEKYFSTCKMGDPAKTGEVLLAMIYQEGTMIKRIELIYVNRESLSEDLGE